MHNICTDELHRGDAFGATTSLAPTPLPGLASVVLNFPFCSGDSGERASRDAAKREKLSLGSSSGISVPSSPEARLARKTHLEHCAKRYQTQARVNKCSKGKKEKKKRRKRKQNTHRSSPYYKGPFVPSRCERCLASPSFPFLSLAFPPRGPTHRCPG